MSTTYENNKLLLRKIKLENSICQVLAVNGAISLNLNIDIFNDQGYCYQN